MSAEIPSAAFRDRATPGVDGRRPPLQKSDTAVRACLGRFTVDIVSTAGGLLAVVGDGVGRSPVSAEITPTTVAIVLELAAADGIVEEITVWKTQAWPLAA